MDLFLFTGLALAYGLGAARPRRAQPDKQPDQRRMAGTAPRPGSAQAVPIRVLPVSTVAAGVVALLAGLLAWAYTLAVLTPAMPLVGRSAPMPGGDGELYMWVAELRWASIPLAALGLLLTTADRRAGPLAAVMQTVALLAADGVLARSGAAGAAGLRTALGVSAVAAGLAWWMAGAVRRRSVDVLAVRRSLAAVAVSLVALLPLLSTVLLLRHPGPRS